MTTASRCAQRSTPCAFGWFYPFFFVGTGVKFDIAALGKDLTTMLLVPAFVILFLIIRGVPVFLYRKDLSHAAAIAVRPLVGDSLIVDHRRHYRSRGAHGNDESGCCNGPRRFGAAVGAALPDDCRCPAWQDPGS